MLTMSKSQLNAFMLKVNGDPSLKAKVDAAVDPGVVVSLAAAEGHTFSPAAWTRHLRD